jgi:hypothetical protein
MNDLSGEVAELANEGPFNNVILKCIDSTHRV